MLPDGQEKGMNKGGAYRACVEGFHYANEGFHVSLW